MKLAIFLLFIISVNISFSQQKEIDSLEIVFSKIETDSLLLLELRKKATFYQNRNSELHFYIIEKALNKLKTTSNETSEALFIRELGVYYRKRGLLDSAIVNYNKAIEKFTLLKDSLGVIVVKSSLANTLKAKGSYPESIKILNEVISYYEKKGGKSRKNALIAKLNLGNVYVAMSDWNKADKYFEEIYNDSIIKANKKLSTSLCINLSVTKSRLNKLDEALKYGKIAETSETRPRSLANLYVNIGFIYQEQKKHQKAHNYYSKSLDIYSALKK